MKVIELNVSTGEIIERDHTQLEIASIEASKPSEAELLAQKVKTYDTATQSRLDEFAQKRGYRDMIFCIGYEKSTVEQWASDALKMIKARDDTWTKALDIMQDVQNGEITLPTIDEYLSMLPVLAWD